MAGYRGHLAGASTFFLIYLAALVYLFSFEAAYRQFSTVEQIAMPLALFGLCLMFGLWPDVDTDSKGQNLFYTIFFLVDVVLIAASQFQFAAYLGLFAILPALGAHRGWTHTWWAMLVIPSPFLILPYYFIPNKPLIGLPFYGAAVVGYLSHLWMDGLVRLFNRRRSR